MDVAINADAVHWEDRVGRPILNLAHACFSAAVVFASVATGLLRWAGAGPVLVFALAAAIVILTALVMRPEPWGQRRAPRGRGSSSVCPCGCCVIGALGAVAFWIEGAWQDWGAVYLERILDAPPAASALGPALFAAAMTVGRLAAHRIAQPGTEKTVLVVGAALAGVGSALAALAPSLPVALAGIAVAGAGCSVCAPTIVSLAGRAAAAGAGDRRRVADDADVSRLPGRAGGRRRARRGRDACGPRWARVAALAFVLSAPVRCRSSARTRTVGLAEAMRKAVLALPLLWCSSSWPRPAAATMTGAQPAGRVPTTEAASCDTNSLDLVTPGQLTIGTDNPAFPPWFEGTKEFEPWDPTTTPTKKGYEAEVAYGIARELGFSDDQVEWTVVPFNQSFRPGPKKFDFDINQISYLPERANAVDFSDSYYDVEQAVVAVEGTPAASATSIEDLKQYKLGAQIGTTSLEAINQQIEPAEEPFVYDTNNDALSGLKANQVDALVLDFPTALFMAAVQLDNGKVVGRLPAPEGGEYFGVVLEKDSALTACVNEAIATLRFKGTIDELEQKWLAGSAPVLE